MNYTKKNCPSVDSSARIHIFQFRFGNNYFINCTMAYVCHAIAVDDSIKQFPYVPRD